MPCQSGNIHRCITCQGRPPYMQIAVVRWQEKNIWNQAGKQAAKLHLTTQDASLYGRVHARYSVGVISPLPHNYPTNIWNFAAVDRGVATTAHTSRARVRPVQRVFAPRSTNKSNWSKGALNTHKKANRKTNIITCRRKNQQQTKHERK